MPSKTELLAIGHSTHRLDRLLALLAQHEIEALVDIRRFPGESLWSPDKEQSDLSPVIPLRKFVDQTALLRGIV
jgi:hypothetical protein